MTTIPATATPTYSSTATGQVFTVAKSSLRWSNVLSVIFFCGGISFVLLALYGSTMGIKEVDFPVIVRWVIAAVCFLIGVMIVGGYVRTRDYRVEADDQKVVVSNLGKDDTYLWDDANSIYQSITKHYRNGIYVGTTYLYTLVLKSGKKVTFNNTLQRVEDLGVLIQNAISKRAYPSVIAAINSGNTVYFDKIGISREGISNGNNKQILWSEIQGVKVENGVVKVSKQGKWFGWANVPVAKIPNLFVFLSVVDSIIGINTK
jgi:hypothetical protein